MNRTQPPPPVEPIYIPNQATTQVSRLNPLNAYMLMFKNFANFNGRSRRKEYWGATLIHFIVVIGGAAFLEGAGLYVGITFIMGIYLLVSFIPALALTVRRLHDVGKSGANAILAGIPIANFYFFYLTCKDSQKGMNKYGANPKGV